MEEFQGVTSAAAHELAGGGGKMHVDLGFRVYKLAPSNLKAWNPGLDLADDLVEAADNLLPGRTEDDLLVELLLKQGIDLTEPMQSQEIAA